VAELFQSLALMGAPAVVLLAVRYLNRRDNRAAAPLPTPDPAVDDLDGLMRLPAFRVGFGARIR